MQISGADKFQLLLHRHIRKTQSTGNVVKLSIEVNGKIELYELKAAVYNNAFLTVLNSLEITQSFLSIPKWRLGIQQNIVAVTEHNSHEYTEHDIQVNSGHLLHVALLQGKPNSTVVIYAHHVLADYLGIQRIAAILNGDLKQKALSFLPKKENSSFFTKLKKTLQATSFVFRKSPKRLAKLSSAKGGIKTGTSVLRFDEEETKLIDSNAVKNGARISKSAFFLAATAMALKQTLFAGKGESFFLPVPQNQRLRGDESFAVGNDLSFLFYTIPFTQLNNLTEATAFITAQTMQQAKEQMPGSYAAVLQMFRFLPLPVYDFFFKLPTGGAVCSFLFADVGETLPGMKSFLGKEVNEILNFPPNPTPPGLTIVFMKDKGALKIISSYNSAAISENEIAKFEALLKAILTPGFS